MKDENKTKKQLMNELIEPRKLIAESQTSITERERVEEKLKATEERFRDLVEVTSDWVWEVDAQVIYTYVSPKVKDLLGYEVSEVVGKTPFDLMPPDEAKRVFEIFSSIAAQRRPFTFLENTNRHKDGHLVVLETSGVPFFDDDGAFLGYRGIDRNITERKRAEEELRRYYEELEMQVQERTAELTAINEQLKLEIVKREGAEELLRESEKRYRQITEAVTDYIYTVRMKEGRSSETIHGPACIAVTGYTPEEYASDPDLWIRMVHNEDREVVMEQINRLVSCQDLRPIEHRIRRKDGIIRWVKSTLVPHYDTQGRLLSYDGLISDITERKQAEEALKSSETRLRTIIEKNADGIVVVDRKGIVRFVNPAAEVLFDRKAEDLIGEQFGFPMVAAEKAEIDVIQRSGETTVASMRVEEIDWEGEKAYIGSFRDVTERVKMEEELRGNKESLANAQRIAHLGNWDWDIEKKRTPLVG